MRIVMVILLSLSLFSEVHADQELSFNVWIDDREIGRHSFKIRNEESVSTVVSRARMQVKVLFVPVFKYAHDANEIWYDGCLREIESNTKTQGDSFTLVGKGTSKTFALASEKNQQPLYSESYSGCLSSYAYWDRSKLLRPELVNSQTGKISATEFEYVGQSKVPKLSVKAAHYRLTSAEGVIDLWYNEDDDWAALQTLTDSRTLTYVSETL